MRLLGGSKLDFGLRHMNENRHAVFRRQRPRREKILRVERVRRVRRNCRDDQLVFRELLDERLGPRKTFLRRLCVGNRKLNDGLSEDAAHARCLRHARDFFLKVVHVRVHGRAGLNHLQRRQPRPGAHHLARDRLGLRRKNVFLEPFLQAEIVSEPAIQNHRRMRVSIDQTGNDDGAGRVDLFAQL